MGDAISQYWPVSQSGPLSQTHCYKVLPALLSQMLKSSSLSFIMEVEQSNNNKNYSYIITWGHPIKQRLAIGLPSGNPPAPPYQLNGQILPALLQSRSNKNITRKSRNINVIQEEAGRCCKSEKKLRKLSPIKKHMGTWMTWTLTFLTSTKILSVLEVR